MAIHLEISLAKSMAFLWISTFLCIAPAIAQTATRPESPPAAAQSAARDLAAIIHPIRESGDVPGMVAAIVNAAGLEAIGFDGVRQRGSDVKVEIADKFHIGSCTKSMTATLIAMLVEDDELSWKTTVGETFSDLFPNIDPKWNAITLEQLLTHRAGAPADLNADGLWRKLWTAPGTTTEQRLMLVEGVITKPPLHDPGTKYLYANAGFAIAGAMAERVTGESWEQLLRTRLFDPLNMTSGGFGAPGSAENIDQPRGHRAIGTSVPPGPGSDNPAAIGPGGAVHCSIEDWAKYIRLHLNGERDGAGILKPDSFITLHTPYPANDKDKYAMGWSVTTRPWAKGTDEEATGRVLTHSGSNTMWFCVTWIAPEKNFAVLIVCNQGGDKATKACDEVAAALFQDHLKHEPSAAPRAPTE